MYVCVREREIESVCVRVCVCSLVYEAVARWSAHELSHNKVVNEWCIACVLVCVFLCLRVCVCLCRRHQPLLHVEDTNPSYTCGYGCPYTRGKRGGERGVGGRGGKGEEGRRAVEGSKNISLSPTLCGKGRGERAEGAK